MKFKFALFTGAISLFFNLMGSAFAQEFDIVIANGRVMDPETNLDEIRNVGIKGDRIVSVTEDSLEGTRTIDATGLVVAPGFIDTHVHGHDPFTMKLHARDGVTSIMDTEYGSLQIAKYYDAHEGVSIINYGTTVSHEFARIAVMDGVIGTESTFVYTVRDEAEKVNGSKWVTQKATPEQIQEMKAWFDRGLAEGAIGGATTVGYFKVAATSLEVFEIQKTVNEWGRLMGAHPRQGPHDEPPTEYPLGFKEVIANALALGQPLIASHINFAGWQETQELLVGLREQGHIIWGEQYPWVAGGPSAGAAITSPENLKAWGFEIEDVVLDPSTGKYLTEEEYITMRKEAPGTNLIVFSRPKEWLPQLVATPDLAIVSDCLASFDAEGGFSPQNYPEYQGILPYSFAYEDFKGHPRCAGSRGRSLRLAREHDIPLMRVVSNASYFPAKMLSLSGVQFFDERGRIQEGMIADITIFDPKTVRENSDYLPGKNGLPTTGIPYLLVSGEVVVDDSVVDITNFPGQPIRYAPQESKL